MKLLSDSGAVNEMNGGCPMLYSCRIELKKLLVEFD